MPKSWPSDLTDAIAMETMGLATCFKITRQDGEVFRFTDHDVDIIIDEDRDSTSSHTYKAASGYTRSTMASKEDLSVDTLDMEGLIQAEVVTDDDLRAGKYDHAEFEMFLVDWQTDHGKSGIRDINDTGPLRKGRLGQLSMGDETYEVEFRGLKQALGVVQGGVIQPVCRVDLFSAKCGLVAADYENPGVVDAVTNNRQFTVEQKETVAVKFDLTDVAPFSLGDSQVPFPYDIADLREVEETEDGGLIEASGAEDGTRARPFLLSSTTDINTTLRDNAINGYYWALDQSIDFVGFGDFTPIDNFFGFLDGRGFDIENLDLLLNVALEKDHAFFRATAQKAVIKRLGFVDPTAGSTTGPNGEGNAVIVSTHNGIIEDCYTDGGTINAGTDPFEIAPLVYVMRGNAATSPTSGFARTRFRARAIRCWSSTELLNISIGGNAFRIGGAIGYVINIFAIPADFPEKGGVVYGEPGRGIDDDVWFDSDVTTWNVTNGINMGGVRRANNVDSTADVGTEIITTPAAHAFDDRSGVTFRINSGALPLPLEENKYYFMERISATEMAIYPTRQDTILPDTSKRIQFTDQVGNFTMFQWGPRNRKLTTAQAQNAANHPNLDYLTHYAQAVSDYPRILDPGRDGGGTVTGPMIRTRGVDVSNLGTYQSSAVRWTADTPGSSSVTVYTSTDGVTFTALASSGDPVAGLTAGVTSLSGLFVTIIVELTISGTDRPTLTSLEFEMANDTDQYVLDAGPPNLDPTDDDWFVKGNLMWNTGKNAGLSMEVKTWDFSGLEFTLFLPMPFDVEPGDSFTVLPGCRKRASEDCNMKFNNIENFRGEPHVPGNDQYLSTPDSTGGKS